MVSVIVDVPRYRMICLVLVYIYNILTIDLNDTHASNSIFPFYVVVKEFPNYIPFWLLTELDLVPDLTDQLMALSLICLAEFYIIESLLNLSCLRTFEFRTPLGTSLLLLTLLNIGFHRASATGVACWQGTLTPPDTWSCPTLGLASVLMLRSISPELVFFLDFWVSNIPRYLCFCCLSGSLMRVQ